MKTCIFIVGDRNAGKSSIVRALTGYSRRRDAGLWNVRNKRGKQLSAFIILSAVTELGARRHPPDTFPETVENHFHIHKRDYEVLICPFELRTWRGRSIDRYILSLRRKNFEVKVAIIKKMHNGRIERRGQRQINRLHIRTVKRICQQNNITPLILNANNDQNAEAGRIRILYP